MIESETKHNDKETLMFIWFNKPQLTFKLFEILKKTGACILDELYIINKKDSGVSDSYYVKDVPGTLFDFLKNVLDKLLKKSCITNNNIIILPIGFHFKGDAHGHSNVVVISKIEDKYFAEIFEPHGRAYIEDLTSMYDHISEILKSILKDCTVKKPGDICPRNLRLQGMVSGIYSGSCLMFSHWYMLNRLFIPSRSVEETYETMNAYLNQSVNANAGRIMRYIITAFTQLVKVDIGKMKINNTKFKSNQVTAYKRMKEIINKVTNTMTIDASKYGSLDSIWIFYAFDDGTKKSIKEKVQSLILNRFDYLDSDFFAEILKGNTKIQNLELTNCSEPNIMSKVLRYLTDNKSLEKLRLSARYNDSMFDLGEFIKRNKNIENLKLEIEIIGPDEEYDDNVYSVFKKNMKDLLFYPPIYLPALKLTYIPIFNTKLTSDQIKEHKNGIKGIEDEINKILTDHFERTKKIEEQVDVLIGKLVNGTFNYNDEDLLENTFIKNAFFDNDEAKKKYQDYKNELETKRQNKLEELKETMDMLTEKINNGTYERKDSLCDKDLEDHVLKEIGKLRKSDLVLYNKLMDMFDSECQNIDDYKKPDEDIPKLEVRFKYDGTVFSVNNNVLNTEYMTLFNLNKYLSILDIGREYSNG